MVLKEGQRLQVPRSVFAAYLVHNPDEEPDNGEFYPAEIIHIADKGSRKYTVKIDKTGEEHTCTKNEAEAWLPDCDAPLASQLALCAAG